MGGINSKIVPNDYDRIWKEINQLGMNIKCLTGYADAFGFTDDIQKRYENYHTELLLKHQEIEELHKKEEFDKKEQEEREIHLNNARELLKELEAEYAHFKSKKYIKNNEESKT